MVLASRRGPALEELAAECERRGGAALAHPVDVSDADAVQRLADATIAKFGRIDVWINNAAVSVFAPFLETPLTEFRRVIDVDVMGYVHGCRSALQAMTEEGRGSIINVASIVGEVPQPYTASYGMSKAAVRALGVSLRSELALSKQKKVHVSTVLPPTIDTPFFQHSANHTGRKIVAMPPVYEADAVARAIVSLIGHPKNELVVGRLGRSLVKQHRRAPEAVEAQMALQVEKTHLSRKVPAPATSGTLLSPRSGELGQITGGWNGKRRHGSRKLVGAALVSVGVVLLFKRLAPAVGAAYLGQQLTPVVGAVNVAKRLVVK